MKQRFSSLDVKVITKELASEIVNLRVSNIYDLSSRIFLFKLAKPDHRRQLIVDSGFRCHVTQYSRATATTPSPFVSRLRKSLKSRRITSVEQIGTDRIIDFTFSDGMYHLFLEFFAGGNIILTDREYNIIALFRNVPAGEGQEEVKLGLKYTVTDKQGYQGVPEITLDRIRETLEKAKELFAKEGGAPKKSKKKGAEVLRKALSQGFSEYPPLLLDHAFAVQGFDPSTPLEQVLGDDALLQQVNGVLEAAQSVTRDLSTGDSHPGYIVVKEHSRPAPEATGDDGEAPAPEKPSLLYEDFHPFRPRQFDGKPGVSILEFERFNATVDEYFSSLESQKLESRLTDREDAARRKLEVVRQEHEKRIGDLKNYQELHIRKAGAIEDNVYRVQEAMDAVNGLIAQGMDWVEIARLIEMEQGRGNPVAGTIKLPLKLYENTITLLLGEAGEEQDEEDALFSSDDSDAESESDEEGDTGNVQREPTMLTIDIDLGLSPWANATQYYDQKKAAAVKQQKTTQSSSKALKSHEKKVMDDLKRNLKQEKQVLRQTRTPFWFEKFLFFVSSEGYLVLGGRDAMQSEVLYRRHLKKGDIFVNADLDGASPMIVKNRNPDAPIPPSTLSQAGNLCVATSIAWDSKAVMSAWWVHANQVSKTAELGGGLLPTGQFQAKGEKNFLAPSQLVLGFAIMFQISKESLKNHKTHRFEEFAATESTPKDAVVTEPAVEDTDRPEQEQDAEESAEPAADGDDQKKEQTTESDDDEDEDDDEKVDEVPVKNPLQRGVAESGTTQGTEGGEESQDVGEEEGGQTVEVEPSGEDQGTLDVMEKTQDKDSPQKQGKRHLSAKEKRSLRKGKRDEHDDNSSVVTTDTQATSTNAPRQAQPPTRGKKAKAKKAAAKYAHQDDEERELALRLLGTNKAKAEKAAAAIAAKENKEREVEAQKQRRKAQHERAAEAERKRQALFAEGNPDDYDEETAAAEAADLAWIPALIGTPVPEDEVLAAIPVCAPWGALGQYKYRVKLQPGTVKKGKAVKEMHGRWVAEMTTGKVRKDHAEEAGINRSDAEKLRSHEGELVKAWKDAEIVNTLPVGKVRIMTGGGAAGGDGKAKGNKGGANKGGKGGKKK